MFNSVVEGFDVLKDAINWKFTRNEITPNDATVDFNYETQTIEPLRKNLEWVIVGIVEATVRLLEADEKHLPGLLDKTKFEFCEEIIGRIEGIRLKKSGQTLTDHYKLESWGTIIKLTITLRVTGEPLNA